MFSWWELGGRIFQQTIGIPTGTDCAPLLTNLLFILEFEIKETSETIAYSSYLDLYLYIDDGKLFIRLHDKQDDSNFPIVNFPFLSSNIPSAPHTVFTFYS